MPLLSGPSPFDEIVAKATNENLPSENWELILEICDQVKLGGAKAAKECLHSLKKRLNHRNPHAILYALQVVDSCMSNCGKMFHLEVCSKEFTNELRSKATGSNPPIAQRTRQLIRRWCEEEIKNDSSLSLLSQLYNELKREGFDFPDYKQSKRAPERIPTDPNVVVDQKEADDIAKAIELSLKDSGSGIKSSGFGSGVVPTSSLYPSGPMAPPPTRVVKALYDFEAAEDNEMTFKAGELINVLDDSDVNWWRGTNHRGEGLFPASFVSADLTAPIEQINLEPVKKKSVQFDEKVEVQNVEPVEEQEPPRIDEGKLNRCIELLEDADPTGDRPDSEELLQLEDQCAAMGPLIDEEIARVDRQHNQLAEINVKLMDALNLYHSVMKEEATQLQAQFGSQQFQQAQFASLPPQGIPAVSYGNYVPSPQSGQIPQMQSSGGMGPTSLPPDVQMAAALSAYSYSQQIPQQSTYQPQYAPQAPIYNYPVPTSNPYVEQQSHYKND